MNCKYLEHCPLYNDQMPMEHGIGSIFKKKYCLSNHAQCARFQVVSELGEHSVPVTLYPSMHEIAQKIIKEAKK